MSCVPRGRSILVTRAQLGEERVARELVAERRRRPVPGEDDRLGRVRVRERADRVEQRLPVAEGQVDPADGAGEENVAGEERAVGVVGEVAGRVARHVAHLEGDPGRVDGLSAGEKRRVAGVRRAS